MITLFENFKNNDNLPKIGDWIAIEPDPKGTFLPLKFRLTDSGKKRDDDFEPFVGKVYYIDSYSINKPLSWFIVDDDIEDFVLTDMDNIAYKVYQDGILGWGKTKEEAEMVLQANKFNI